MAEESSGSTAILGVIVGAVLVLVILFFAFGGPDIFAGGDGEITVDVDVPAAEPAPAPAANPPPEGQPGPAPG